MLHFDKPEEKENRELLNALRSCKQQPIEPTRLFNAKWQHLLSLLPKDHLTDEQQVVLYTKALYNQGVRTTLVTYMELSNITKVSKLIKKALQIGDKARLNTINNNDNSTGSNTTSEIEDPMEIDYIGGYKH